MILERWPLSPPPEKTKQCFLSFFRPIHKIGGFLRKNRNPIWKDGCWSIIHPTLTCKVCSQLFKFSKFFLQIILTQQWMQKRCDVDIIHIFIISVKYIYIHTHVHSEYKYVRHCSSMSCLLIFVLTNVCDAKLERELFLRYAIYWSSRGVLYFNIKYLHSYGKSQWYKNVYA